MDLTEILECLTTEYRNYRNPIAHGMNNVEPETILLPRNYDYFCRFHELARLSILGFLSMDVPMKDELLKGTGASVQNALDGIVPATGEFINRKVKS